MIVLILEDLPDQAFVMSYYLKKMGFETVITCSGYEALQLINKIHIIVTDLAMPEMSGIDFIKYVRESSQVPIIVVSAHAEEFTKQMAFQAGANYYLTKPILPSDLTNVFKQWLS